MELATSLCIAISLAAWAAFEVLRRADARSVLWRMGEALLSPSWWASLQKPEQWHEWSNVARERAVAIFHISAVLAHDATRQLAAKAKVSAGRAYKQSRLSGLLVGDDGSSDDALELLASSSNREGSSSSSGGDEDVVRETQLAWDAFENVRMLVVASSFCVGWQTLLLIYGARACGLMVLIGGGAGAVVVAVWMYPMARIGLFVLSCLLFDAIAFERLFSSTCYSCGDDLKRVGALCLYFALFAPVLWLVDASLERARLAVCKAVAAIRDGSEAAAHGVDSHTRMRDDLEWNLAFCALLYVGYAYVVRSFTSASTASYLAFLAAALTTVVWISGHRYVLQDQALADLSEALMPAEDSTPMLMNRFNGMSSSSIVNVSAALRAMMLEVTTPFMSSPGRQRSSFNASGGSEELRGGRHWTFKIWVPASASWSPIIGTIMGGAFVFASAAPTPSMSALSEQPGQQQQVPAPLIVSERFFDGVIRVLKQVALFGLLRFEALDPPPTALWLVAVVFALAVACGSLYFISRSFDDLELSTASDARDSEHVRLSKQHFEDVEFLGSCCLSTHDGSIRIGAPEARLSKRRQRLDTLRQEQRGASRVALEEADRELGAVRELAAAGDPDDDDDDKAGSMDMQLDRCLAECRKLQPVAGTLASSAVGALSGKLRNMTRLQEMLRQIEGIHDRLAASYTALNEGVDEAERLRDAVGDSAQASPPPSLLAEGSYKDVGESSFADNDNAHAELERKDNDAGTTSDAKPKGYGASSTQANPSPLISHSASGVSAAGKHLLKVYVAFVEAIGSTQGEIMNASRELATNLGPGSELQRTRAAWEQAKTETSAKVVEHEREAERVRREREVEQDGLSKLNARTFSFLRGKEKSRRQALIGTLAGLEAEAEQGKQLEQQKLTSLNVEPDEVRRLPELDQVNSQLEVLRDELGRVLRQARQTLQRVENEPLQRLDVAPSSSRPMLNEAWMRLAPDASENMQEEELRNASRQRHRLELQRACDVARERVAAMLRKHDAFVSASFGDGGGPADQHERSLIELSVIKHGCELPVDDAHGKRERAGRSVLTTIATTMADAFFAPTASVLLQAFECTLPDGESCQPTPDVWMSEQCFEGLHALSATCALLALTVLVPAATVLSPSFKVLEAHLRVQPGDRVAVLVHPRFTYLLRTVGLLVLGTQSLGNGGTGIGLRLRLSFNVACCLLMLHVAFSSRVSNWALLRDLNLTAFGVGLLLTIRSICLQLMAEPGSPLFAPAAWADLTLDGLLISLLVGVMARRLLIAQCRGVANEEPAAAVA